MCHFVQRTEIFPDSLQQRADDEDVVEGRQTDQDPVEDGGHALAQQDGDGDEVAGEADGANDHLQQPGVKWLE